MAKKCNLYLIHSKAHYVGTAIVSAETANQAKEVIKEFKLLDSDNSADSWGWDDDISEDDILPNAFGTFVGIISNDIYYHG